MKQKQICLVAVAILVFSLVFEPTLRRMSLPVFSQQRETRVLIDPGHGGIDGGAIGVTGVVEKEINLEISKKLADLFAFCGVSTCMTRTEDQMQAGGKKGDTKARVALADDLVDGTLISVHLNFYPQESCHGAQVFYSRQNQASEPLAKTIQTSLVTGLDPKNHRVAKQAGREIYLLQHVHCPAVLVECGFLSNYEEERKLTQAAYQTQIALCVAAGYLTFTNEWSGAGEGENDFCMQ